MKIHYIIKSFLFCCFLSGLFLLNLPLKAQKNSCIECHNELEDELKAPVEAFKTDIHQQFGLTCSTCHGGNQNEDDIELAKDDTFKTAPERKDDPEFCGRCHSDFAYMRNFNPSIRVDQLELYWTSQHGQLLRKGDSKVAVCSDCHGIHGILPATHPKSKVFPWNLPQTCSRCHSDKEYMEDYKIPINQWDEYKDSVHAQALFEKKDLSAPVCNDCHSNHGAAPPEVTAISYVCRQCHPSAGDLFSQSPHKVAFDEMEISECEACHGNHKILPPTDEMLGTGEGAVCIECHDPESRAYETATVIKQMLERLKSNIENVEDILSKANTQGVEVSEPEFKLQDAVTILIQVRNLTHSFSLDKIEEKVEEGEKIIAEVTEEGEAALKEAQFRKRGLIIATFFIFLVVIALFLKVRQIERKAPQ